MENLENRLQRVEKALKSMSNPIKKMFDEQQQLSDCHEEPALSSHGKKIKHNKKTWK